MPPSLRSAHPARWKLLVALAVFAVAPVQAQGDLDAAVARYEAAEFAAAIDLLSDLAERPDTDVMVRKEALEYLGRAYVAESRHDQARATIDRLIGLEPPEVTLDPEIEHPDLVRLYYEARRDSQGGDYAVEHADPGLTTLAIVDFTNSSVTRRDDFDPLRQGFASMMIHYLSGATDLKVIERERLQWLLDELELQQESGAVDPATAVRAGKLLGATAVLFGAFSAAGDRLWVSARLVKVETGEVLLAEQAFGDPDDFFSLVEKLSLQVAETTDATLEQADIGERRETDSLDAMLAFSQGLALAEQGDLPAAQARYEQALAHDPSYERAQHRLNAILPVAAR